MPTIRDPREEAQRVLTQEMMASEMLPLVQSVAVSTPPPAKRARSDGAASVTRKPPLLALSEELQVMMLGNCDGASLRRMERVRDIYRM